MKTLNFLIIALLLTATPVWAQKVMQVHSGGEVVYEIPTAQVDSVTFKTEEEKFPKTIIPTQIACGNVQGSEGEAQIFYPGVTQIYTQSEWEYLLAKISQSYDISNFGETNIDFSPRQCYNILAARVWRNWQTRWI